MRSLVLLPLLFRTCLSEMMNLAVLVLAATILHLTEASAVCDDPTSVSKVKRATNEIVRRLMGMRKPDWTWSDPLTAVVLQVTVSKKFFGRKHTTKVLEDFIKDNFLQMNLRQKSEYIMAVKAMCLNPYNTSGINMVENVREEVLRQFPNEDDKYPAIGYDMFSIGIGSLCVNGETIEEWFMDKVLSGQNENGSFGDEDLTEAAIKLLPPLQCLVQMENPAFNVTKVEEAVGRLREYIIHETRESTDSRGRVRSKMMTSMALIGLRKSKRKNEKPSKWRCSDLSGLLGIFPGQDEDEISLRTRLMRLHGAAFMDVGKRGYKCVDPDPIPKGYKPTCNRKFPATCKPKAGMM